MDTEITDKNARTCGWLFYDGDCLFCCRTVHRFERVLSRRGIRLRTLQSPDAPRPRLLGLTGSTLLHEMHLLLKDGRKFGGADAVAEIARRIWWAWPVWLLSRVSGFNRVGHAIYRAIAANRHCIGGACRIDRDATGEKPGETSGRKVRHRHAAFFEFP